MMKKALLIPLTIACIENGIAQSYKHQVGKISYEIKNHLGSVSAVVNDVKNYDLVTNQNTANLQSVSNYDAFGMEAAGRVYASSTYRYGYNGKEKDNELNGNGNSLDYGARIYDPRIGRWLSNDPLQVKYSNLSPYNYVANNPISNIDPDGKEIKGVTYNKYTNSFSYSSGALFRNSDKIIDVVTKTPEGKEAILNIINDKSLTTLIYTDKLVVIPFNGKFTFFNGVFLPNINTIFIVSNINDAKYDENGNAIFYLFDQGKTTLKPYLFNKSQIYSSEDYKKDIKDSKNEWVKKYLKGNAGDSELKEFYDNPENDPKTNEELTYRSFFHEDTHRRNKKAGMTEDEIEKDEKSAKKEGMNAAKLWRKMVNEKNEKTDMSNPMYSPLPEEVK